VTSTIVPRFAGATALGALVTGLVLLLMQSLIDSDGAAVAEPPPGHTLSFVPVIEDLEITVEDPRPQEPPKPEVPPPPPQISSFDPLPMGDGFTMNPPESAPPSGPAGGTMSDGEALPIVKVRPVYPQRAISRGIEGHVLVQFTIDELGRVVDATVLHAEPRGVFERAALQAVERFRYKPRVVNGEPLPVSGVQHRLTFELDG